MNCYCGKNQSYADCCEKFHLGKAKPDNAEDLMRSRYSAFCVVNMDYLFETTDIQARFDIDKAANEAWAKNAEFKKLYILKAEENGTKSIVEFKAYFKLEGEDHIHHEISTFRKNNGSWYYRSGRVIST